MIFRWNEWNLNHVREHGIEPWEAEQVVLRARAPFPKRYGNKRFFVWAPGLGGRLVQVVYVVDPDKRCYVIHARPLAEIEKRRFRRRYR